MDRSTTRQLRTFIVATAVAVGGVSALTYAVGATIAQPSVPPAKDPHVHDGPQVPAPPRFVPIAGPNGKTVVDADGKPLMMDTQPGTGQPNPNGQTLYATSPDEAATNGPANASPAPRVVRPYDDTKYREK